MQLHIEYFKVNVKVEPSLVNIESNKLGMTTKCVCVYI